MSSISCCQWIDWSEAPVRQSPSATSTEGQRIGSIDASTMDNDDIYEKRA
jgi:hypothetical protein